jgi:hypothetical protein
MPFSALVGVGTLVFTFVNFLTYLRSANWNGVITQLIAWAAGIGGVMIAVHTQFAPAVKVGSLTFDKINTPTQLFLGLIATSIFSTVNEIKKAVDNKDSAAKAQLLTGKMPSALAEQAGLRPTR